MNDPSSTAKPIDPEEVLDAHGRALASAYRVQLRAAYVDPESAYEQFRAEAARRGLGNAAIAMREEPDRFGTLKEAGDAHARAAAELGVSAYHARMAKGEPALAADVLNHAFAETVRGLSADPGRVADRWEALSTAYGPDAAAALFERRARDILPPATSPDTASRLASLAAARDLLRERAGLAAPPAYERSQPLPRSLQDERSADTLPDPLQARLVAACDGMRRRLAAAYEDPLAAEARLHALVDEMGIEAITRADLDPTRLGALRAHLPGWGDAADAAARSALDYAQIVYSYHLARAPEEVADRIARDQIRGTRMAARDPQRAMDDLHEAAQLHGPELAAHLSRRRDRGPGRGPARGGPEPGAEIDRGSQDPAPGNALRSREHGRAGDPAVEDAVRAHEAMHEARELSELGRQLRGERASAERVLARLDQQDAELNRARRDFVSVAQAVYQNPDAALEKWDRLVLREEGSLERARDRLIQSPEVLGPLRTERQRGWRGAIGLRTTAPAREEVPRLALRATSYTRARRAVTDPVDWATPDGERVSGRERVRAAATAVLQDRQGRLDAADRRLQEIGGVRGSERAAQHALGQLSPAQSKAAAQIAKRRGISLVSATSVARLGMEAGRVARSLSEGPAGL